MSVKGGQYMGEKNATMNPDAVPLLKSSYTPYKLVNNKLAPINIISETIFMDGMP